MIKLHAIPSILVATALVAGVFALIPIEEASTVHTTITGSMMTLQRGVVDTSGEDVANNEELEITSAGAFCVVNILATYENIDADDALFTNEIEIGNLPLLDDRSNSISITWLARQNTNDIDRVINIWSDSGFDSIGSTYICANANVDMDFIFSDNQDALGVGDVDNIQVIALVDGDNALIVTQGAAD